MWSTQMMQSPPLHGPLFDTDFDQSPPDRLTKQLRKMLLMPADELQIAMMSLRFEDPNAE
jgi:hypothetical protein